MPNRDPLDKEVSITAKLEENGITASTKSRAIAALDRLIGSTIDIPGAFVEGLSSKIRLKNELEEFELRERAKINWDQATEFEKLEHRSKVYRVEQELRGQLNRESVAKQAIEDLQESDQETAQENTTIDEDWMNFFAQFSSQASSKRLQSLWAKILSGQIRKPGSFSLTTLRIISELDQEIAVLFQKTVVGVVDTKLLIKPTEIKGQVLIDLTFLEEVGLLQDSTGTVGLTQEYDDQGHYHFVNGNLLLRSKGTPNGKFRIPCAKISRAGVELLSILPKEEDEVSLKKIAKIIEPHSKETFISRIEMHPNGAATYTDLEKLK